MPGRDLNGNCLGYPPYSSLNPAPPQGFPAYCIVDLGEVAENADVPQLFNRTEFLKTAGNFSSLNRVYLSNGYAVLGPAEPPQHIDFQATSFAAKSSCRAVTTLCGLMSTFNKLSADVSQFNFVCNSTGAGLNMTGNFLNVLAPLKDNKTTGLEVDDAIIDGEVVPNQVVLGGNTIAGNSFDIGFQFFKDAEKQQQTPTPDMYTGLPGDDEAVRDQNQIHWALAWYAPFSSPLDGAVGQRSGNGTAAVYKNGRSKDGSFGILSCDTNISEVVGQSCFLPLGDRSCDYRPIILPRARWKSSPLAHQDQRYQFLSVSVPLPVREPSVSGHSWQWRAAHALKPCSSVILCLC